MAPPDIAGYTIDRLLGRGGFASVYLATRHTDGRPVAVKVLFEHIAGTDALIRFERERLSMSALSAHPHIVDVLDGGTTLDGHHYLVLEYLPGGSVKDRLVDRGALAWPEVIAIGIQICSALDAAHRIGVLHRDCKPANIFVGADDVKLGDFGIARLVGSTDVTAVESIIGTLAYTPPEILQSGAFDGRGDIYQLGITLYEMLLGRAPFKSGASDSKAVVIRRILEDPAPPLAQFDIPAPLSDLLDEVLAKDPADRPQTASEFARRLGEVEDLLDTPRTPFTGTTPGPPPVPRSSPPDRDLDPTVSRSITDRTEAAPAPTPRPAPRPPDRAAPTDPSPPASPPGKLRTRGPRRRRLFALVGVLLSAAVAAGLLTSSLRGDGDNVTVPDDQGVPDVDPQLRRIDTPAFAAPAGSDGIVFSAVANTAGLTAVGSAGDGEGVDTQRGVVWTMDADGSWAHQDGFASSDTSSSQQRLRDVAVIDGVRLLAVGEHASGSSIDGIAWLGLTVGRMRSETHGSFTGGGRQSLQGAVGDPGRQQFLVVGERGGTDGPRPGLWILAAGDDWFDPQWTPVDVGLDQVGTLTDVAVAGDLAVAAGHTRSDRGVSGVVLIRRGEVWSPLIEPVSDTELNAVDIFGDRIVAVGTRSRNDISEPIAIVSDVDGIGFIHRLPVAGVSGRAWDVVSSAAGVFVAGTSGEIPGDQVFETRETDGVLWRLVPGADPSADVWGPVAADESRVLGFEEFWSVVEFDGSVFVLGRADGAPGRRPAAGWTVATADIAEGPALGGCAERAEDDVGSILEVVLSSATDGFAVWICADESGQLWYHGASRTEQEQWITLPAEAVSGGYEAVNTGGTTYRVVDGRLTVRAPSGAVRTDQALID